MLEILAILKVRKLEVYATRTTVRFLCVLQRPCGVYKR